LLLPDMVVVDLGATSYANLVQLEAQVCMSLFWKISLFISTIPDRIDDVDNNYNLHAVYR
jgi:hypothetical protein